jgi:pSer/pThr/pTyr-binding forkhead associated (FHA) protein
MPALHRDEPPPAPKKPAGPPPGTPLAYLIGRSGDLKGQRFPIKVPIVNVGRAEYNDVVLTDGSVSTMHAKLQRREGIWVLTDLESTNGTMVDGERVEGETPLAPGAFIRFGDVSMVFEPTDDTVDAPKGSSTSVLNSDDLAKLLRERQGGGSSGS